MNDDQEHWQHTLRQLPTYEPRPDTWHHIEELLDLEEAVEQAKSELPTYGAAADTWHHLAARIDTSSSRPVRRWWRYAAAAAVVTLGVFVWYQLPPEEALSYREETAAESVLTYQDAGDDPLEIEALALVQQACAEQRPVCQTAEFQRLTSHLEELSEQEAELSQTMKQLGYDPQLIKYQVRIENLKADATKELIQLVL